ncbi:MAG: 50S ribosomal protein L9 [Candidatus Binatia bacterium]
MEVILREDVPSLGIIGDVVKVKPGYARNYLFPQGLAVAADRRSLARLEHEKGLIEVKKQRERGTYERMAETLKKLRLEIEARAGRGGKLFGSVTNIDVHRLIVEKGLDIDRRRIELKEPIKEIGEFTVLVRVGQDIVASVPLSVKAAGGMLEGGDEGDGEASES